MKVLIEIDEKLKYAFDRFEGSWATDTVHSNASAIAKAIKNGTTLPQNATNGDVIKAMFPNAQIEYWAEYSTYNVEFPNDNDVKHFSYDWWNAPYEAGEEG